MGILDVLTKKLNLGDETKSIKFDEYNEIGRKIRALADIENPDRKTRKETKKLLEEYEDFGKDVRNAESTLSTGWLTSIVDFYRVTGGEIKKYYLSEYKSSGTLGNLPRLGRLTLKELISHVEKELGEYKKQLETDNVRSELALTIYTLIPRILRVLINIRAHRFNKKVLVTELKRKFELLNDFNSIKKEYDRLSVNKTGKEDYYYSLLKNDKFIHALINFELMQYQKKGNKEQLINSLKELIDDYLTKQVKVIEQRYIPLAQSLISAAYGGNIEDIEHAENIIKIFKKHYDSGKLSKYLEADLQEIDVDYFDIGSEHAMFPKYVRRFIDIIKEKVGNDPVFIMNLAHGSTKLAGMVYNSLKNAEWVPIRFSLEKKGDLVPQLSPEQLGLVIQKINTYPKVLLIDEDTASGNSIYNFMKFLAELKDSENKPRVNTNKIYICVVELTDKALKRFNEKWFDKDKIFSIY